MSGVATDTRMPRPEAIAIAKAFVGEIEDCCDQLIVGGSLRRRLAMIGDVEIVCVPKVETRMAGLLADTPVVEDQLAARLECMLIDDVVQKRLDRNGSPRWGPTLKYLTYRGARVDLFSPCAERFGWILLLRTGPAAFSRQLVVERGRRTKDGRPGLLPPLIVPRDGWLTWRVSGERIETRDERAVFDLFSMRYLEPWERT
jgi:DNA polymerase/3'-5' exonuclease PolX